MSGDDHGKGAPEILTGASPAPSYSEQIVEGLASGVVAIDAEGRIIHANPAAYDHLNLSPGTLAEGAAFAGIDGLEPFAEIVREVAGTLKPISRREVYVGEGPVAKKDIGVSVSLLEGPKDYNGIVFLFTDMTERRRLERAAEVNDQLASVGKMAAGMVHELRNPLTIISGRAQLMMRKAEEDEELRAGLESIMDEAHLLDLSISQFLGFAKPFELAPAMCSVNDVTTRSIDLCKQRALRKGVKLLSDSEEDFEDLYIDRERVAEALANIISNAVDAVDQGGRVQLHAYQGGTMTVFEIWDDGPGIHLEAGEDLFSPFFSKKRDGTGLGLSIVQRIAAAQGGSVTYSNHIEGGALFEFVIPTIHGRKGGSAAGK